MYMLEGMQVFVLRDGCARLGILYASLSDWLSREMRTLASEPKTRIRLELESEQLSWVFLHGYIS